MPGFKRLHPRVEVTLDAEYRLSSSDTPRMGRVANLSAGGAAVRTDRQIPPKALIHQFTIYLPAAEEEPEALEASAALIHARPVRGESGFIAYLSGVHFLGFRQSQFERLQEFLDTHLEEAPVEPV